MRFFIFSLSLLILRNLKNRKLSTKTVESEFDCKGWGRKLNDSMNKVFEYKIQRPSLFVISSLMSGLVTGLVGLGGGITDTTTMVLLGIPSHIAVASSEFAMALTNGVGVISHGFMQNIHIGYAIPITIGTILGAQAGVLIAKRIKQKTLKVMLYLVSLVFSLRLLLDFFLA